MKDVWTAIGGIVAVFGIIGVLLRISYQLGRIVTEFREYVKLNDIIVGKIDDRVTLLERRRR